MSKKNAQKVKERAKKVKEKILRRREALRKKAKADNEERLAQREAQKIANRVDGRTIINRSPKDQHNLLQRNLDILKALEDQQKFLDEERARRPVPQVQEQHERARGMKQSADVQFIPNPEPVAETNAEVDLAPKISDDSTIEQAQQFLEEVFDAPAIDSAATRLAEKLESLSKKRTMGIKK